MTTPLATQVARVCQSRVSARVLLGIVEVFEEVGLSRARLFAAAALDPALAPHASVSREETHRLCEAAMLLSRDATLGLHCAERLRAATFNPLSHLVLHSRTLGQSLDSLLRFHRLLSDETSLRLMEHGSFVVLRHSAIGVASLEAKRFWAEFLMSSVLCMIRSIRPGAKIERVHFTHAAPAHHDEYTRVFKAPVFFDRSFTELVFARSLLDAVCPHSDQDVHDAMRAIAQQRIDRGSHSYAEQVRDCLIEKAMCADMSDVARSVGISVRSLRRRLSEEHKSFKDIQKEAQAIIAQSYLRDNRLTIGEVAFEMGFSDTTSFHRAFKRWTGTTPMAARAG